MVQPFKPASAEQLANMPVDGVKVESLVVLDSNRMNSFWYSGDVAVITYTCPDTRESRKLTLAALGEIKMVFVDDPDRICLDGEAVEEARRRGYKDADLVEENKDGGKVKKWIRNNWFQFGYESSKRVGRADIGVRDGGDVFFGYNEGISAGKDIITDKKKWSELVSELIDP